MLTQSESPGPGAEFQTSADLLAFIEASPTPFHAAASAAQRLIASGFVELRPDSSFSQLQPGRYFVPVGDATIVAFVLPQLAAGKLRGFRIVGAHTDSPNLRLKPRAPYEKAGYLQLGVEVYGGVLLNSWLDRDLLLAGRVVYRDSEGRLGGLITSRDWRQAVSHPDALRDAAGSLAVAAAVGVGEDGLQRAAAQVEAGVDCLVVDSAHGHSDGVLRAVAALRKRYPHLQIMGGNIATAEGALALVEAGANMVKVGMGPGSICTTRVVSGVGAAQFGEFTDCRGQFGRQFVEFHHALEHAVFMRRRELVQTLGNNAQTISVTRDPFRLDRQQLSITSSLGVTSLVAGYVLSDILARYRRALAAFGRGELMQIDHAAPAGLWALATAADLLH